MSRRPDPVEIVGEWFAIWLATLAWLAHRVTRWGR